MTDAMGNEQRSIERDQPLILAIETATRAGSVAVARGNQVLSTREGDAAVSHSANLIEMIEGALHDAQATLADIDLFAVAVGPGSFTGLRIGLATVKAFAAAMGTEIVGVSTLAAVAYAAGESESTVALLPAGRGEVFAQMFSVRNGEAIPIDQAGHLTPAETAKRYDSMARVRWTGEGLQKMVDYFRGLGGDWASGDGDANVKLAVAVARLALNQYREGKSVKASDLHAAYVRPSDAEINERWQQQKAQQ